jgi:hypothetical protein
MAARRIATEAPSNPAKVPPITLVRCFSDSQRSGWLDGVGRVLVDNAAAGRASVDEVREDNVALDLDEEAVGVGVCVEDAPAVDV